MTFDVTIIGAGIVGLATAFQISERKPGLRLCILDKESGPARHQSGRNSGVIHSGIYYRPGGSKALNCRRGYDQLLAFCGRYGVPYEICGKVIVAVTESERPRLRGILERGKANGLEGLRLLGPEETREIEPHVSALESVWVPQTGIISYGVVAERYLQLVQERGAEARFGAAVQAIARRGNTATVVTDTGEVESRLVINCAGLYSDRITRLTMPEVAIRIIPFRGEYYELLPERRHLVRNLIYPVPNPNFPFLGVHFTRMTGGGIEAGPNAVLAFRREGYSRWDFETGEFWETLRFGGFRRIARRYWRDGLDEMRRSYFKGAFTRALRHLIPSVREEDLVRGRAGVRAMACDPGGNLIDDFLILEDRQVINVCNAPSPAATASLAIGETVAEKALVHLGETPGR